MEAFLLLTKDYSISPDARAFMVHGTKGHAVLDGAEDDLSLLEEKFDGPEIDETGIADVIETELGKTILADYKTSGSFKIAKALGFKVVERESEEIYKSGKRAGQHKTIKDLVRDDKYIDRWEWELQLNKYRIEYEKRGKKIDELRIQCIARDGSTFIARSRGIFRNVYYFKITIHPDDMVLDFFKRKREALLLALSQGQWNKACDKFENWGGLKCSRYCAVAEYCYYGKYLQTQKQSEDEMIKGLSEVRRLPRLGKLRLGIKKTTTAGVEYPSEINYFKMDPSTPSELENKNLLAEFERLYGKEPKMINVMFPLPDPGIIFPQFYKRYANGVLRCKGDGEEADCISKELAAGLTILSDSTEMGGVRVKCLGQDCPYYKSKKCSESAVLSFLLPELKGAGVWQITTGSFHSIVNINSCLDYIRAIAGRVHMIPLQLERRETEIIYEGKKSKHYILQININADLPTLQKLATIDPAKIMLELPAPEIDKEDILFLENKNINPQEMKPAELEKEEVKPAIKQEPPAQTVGTKGQDVQAALQYATITEDQALEIAMEIQKHECSEDFMKKIFEFYSRAFRRTFADVCQLPLQAYGPIMKSINSKPIKTKTDDDLPF
jgi:hypothetical protein